MNQIKIGKFICECRKKQNLTQSQLADMLHITDRAISKWENGKSMPDASLMLELCEILKINVNDLLSGEVISMNEYNKKIEDNLLDVIKSKQEADKRLLSAEVFIGVIVTIFLLSLTLVASCIDMKTWTRVVLITLGFIQFIVGCTICLKIEQKAGYYQCGKCNNKYVPNFSSILWAMHAGRTRYLKCPKCLKKSWSKKVIGK